MLDYISFLFIVTQILKFNFKTIDNSFVGNEYSKTFLSVCFLQETIFIVPFSSAAFRSTYFSSLYSFHLASCPSHAFHSSHHSHNSHIFNSPTAPFILSSPIPSYCVQFSPTTRKPQLLTIIESRLPIFRGIFFSYFVCF